MPTDAQRAGDFTALSAQLRNPVNPITNAPFTDSSGAPCVAGNVIRAGCISQVSRDLLLQYVPTSPSGTVVTLSPAPRDHAVYMARGDYHFSGRNQLNAHFFADRSDSSSWPGNVNYVQQGVFSDVNQFGVSDTHIFSPQLVNEITFSYLTSRSGGGALTQIAPRDQGVNVDVGNDGRGMSYSVSGSVNLNYPGVNCAGLCELAGQGHDDLQRGEPHAEVGVRVHQAGRSSSIWRCYARRASPGRERETPSRTS